MKISQELRSQLDPTKKNPLQQPASSKSFGTLVSSQSHKLKEAELNKAIEQLTAQGEKLERFRSFKDLVKYKRMVKDFIQEAVQYGMELKQSHSWNLESNNRKLTIVEQVDEKLMEITELVIDQEKKSISLLGMIGEVKGLLINLYS
ncbi:YaaR family protein [Aquibacillus koreensis]|uniref:YaaR family protein n=1 Tax=Aquibacillus koreensis TaxID=279446 RepID=A0A9X3WLR9_9BACI|nr:YaaR family protein [Aquibacillus koreensis]MCT2534281.1 YaaR family protein [Aquibacillus koreensis]MDC3422412.1 YaaR family protein [Aquibacillus koreensis]